MISTRLLTLLLIIVLFGNAVSSASVSQTAYAAVLRVPTAVTNPDDVLPTPPPVGSTADPITPTGTPPGTPGPTATNRPTSTNNPTDTPAPTGTDKPTATPKPTVTPTPGANARPDTCEPNNDRAQPCSIAIDTVNGPYTFLPDGDHDWYLVDLGQPNGLTTDVAVRSSGKLDLLVTILHPDGTVLGTMSSPTLSTTLQADIGGPVLIHVENRDPDDATGATYNIEVRHTLPPPPVVPPEVAALQQMKPDALENNWNADTAAPIGVGAVYTLNFVCPDPRPDACAGGDHDYLRLAVKAHTTYVVAAFDLGPGVDTVLDLFWGSEDTPVASNDDAGPIGFASLLRWTAPTDGTALVRVGPRTGGLAPLVFDEQASTYHLAVALDGSDLAQQISTRVQEQTQRPTPTPRPAPPASSGGTGGSSGSGNSAPAPAAPPPAAPAPTTLPAVSDIRAGQAVVMVPTTILRAAPNAKAESLQELPGDTLVTLTGQGQGVWVRVETPGGVLPGWVDSRDLRRFDGASTTPGPTAPVSGTTTLTTGNPAPKATDTPAPVVQRLDPVPPAALPDATVRTTLIVSVTVLTDDALRPTATSSTRPTMLPTTPRAGMRVQLVNALGDVLAEAVTPASGQLTLRRDVDVGIAVWVRLPAVGVDVPLDPANPTLTIQVQGGSS